MSNHSDTAHIVQSILIQYFNVSAQEYQPNTPLEKLDEQFEVLSYLIYLEQLLTKHYGKKIPLIENISTSFHTPNDIISLINNTL